MTEAALPAVLLAGAPASGKSTVGRLLAGRLGAALLDQDVATGPLVDVVQRLVGVDDLDDPRLAGLTRAARYEVLWALAESNLRAGVPVVLVAPFTAERSGDPHWAAARGRLAAAGGAPLLVWLRLDRAEVLRRLRARGAARDAAKLLDEGAYLEALAAREAGPPAVPHLELDATRRAADLAAAVRAALTA
ncbi:AAA family ATPase [Angustibacter aerolatus]